MATSSSSSSSPSKTLTLETPLLLPSDLLLEILSRLPVKSLLRFRSVSKSWHALISAAHHRHLLPPPISGLFAQFYISFTSLHLRTFADPSAIDPSLSFLPHLRLHGDANPLHTLHLSSGLLLLKDSSVHHPLYLVANPATRRWAPIPSPPSSDPLELVLSFNPRCSRHYKIVSFPPENEFSDLWRGDRVEVYTSSKAPPGRWAEVGFVRGVGSGVRFDKPRFVVLDEVIFVLDVEGNCYGVDVEGMVCWKVNVVGGGVGVCPKRVNMHCIGSCMGVLHRALLVDGEMLVWALEDCRSSVFVLKHRKRVWDLVDKLYGGGGWDQLGILAFHPDLEVIFLRFKWKLVSYHWLRVEFEESCNIEMYRQWYILIPQKVRDYRPFCYVMEYDLKP